MKRREKLLLTVGIFLGIGIAVAASLLAGRYFLPDGNSSGDPQALMAVPVVGAEPTSHSEHKAHGGFIAGEPVAVQLAPDEQRAAGVQTAKVVWRQLHKETRTTGKVEEAETRLFTASARVGGRIDDLLVDFTGQTVRRGEPLAVIYSPELVTAAEEYKLATEARESLGEDAYAQAKEYANQLVESSRRRLELWGITPTQIEGIASSKQPSIQITIHSPVTGIVTERKVTEGQYVKEGDVLYTVADLSTVWVIAQVYESDLPSVRPGQQVRITSESLPGSTLRGRVDFVEPRVDPQTRTVPVRIEVSNPRLGLRPGMYVTVTLQSEQQRVLAVPRSAVISTGEKNIVYVAHEDGVFEGRAVEVGPSADDMYPILSGLKAGDEVVSRGAFMIDSQTRISGGMTGMFGGARDFEGADKPAKSERRNQYAISFRTDPDPPKGAAENAFHVQLTNQEGKPVPDAQVTLTLVMPAMPSMNMPEMRSSFELKWNGREYTTKGTVSMAGPWNVLIEARRGGRILATHSVRINAR